MDFQLHPNKIRQVLFLLAILIVGYIIAKEMYFMLGAFMGAITLYVLLRSPMIHLVVSKKWPKWVAALVMMLASMVILVVPLVWMVSVLIDKVQPFIQNPDSLNQYFHLVHEYLLSKYKVDILNAENIAKLNAMVLPMVQKTMGSTLSAVGNIFIMYLMLYFMLVNVKEVELWLRNQIPFKQHNVQRIMNEFRGIVYSNALAIPMVAALQGVVGLIGYGIFGVKEFVLMGVLTAICSMIPVVGSMLIYLPLGVYQLAIGNTTNGIFLLLWGFVLIGSVDNIARFMLQKKMANMHPLITLFGVFIGVNMFGFMGIIFGPVLLSMFLLLVKIYVDEFGKANV